MGDRYRGRILAASGGVEERGVRSPYAELLRKVCVGHGYCGCVRSNTPMHVSLLIPNSGYVTADEFACLVMLADGTNPFDEEHPLHKHRISLAEMFTSCFPEGRAHVSQLDYSGDDLSFPDEGEAE